ncbi:Zn(II)2Cys6 transcription factor ASCRUDRAFT_73097 [Ascoidea rubescens DSM 1968]|uniref:Zn(2)-C6 fungal-type domain-containing protein n=1 Tax=Ascoidea rubescens DSM 1968 TaxID=1344418 RepID=A0A1D2V884_9ASCO|nr:hypothetical protein ASCRUDRAFT_73097 [Ascoidea rubescens DSM 1968]ODV57839.1 hypothetical protein ASCRUDRAFT_73097 [Ascoidea rubescens DSM 1968]
MESRAMRSKVDKETHRKTKFKRSRNGCLTCKKRKKKCDETQPFCNNCKKSKRQCEGFARRYKFQRHDKLEADADADADADAGDDAGDVDNNDGESGAKADGVKMGASANGEKADVKDLNLNFDGLNRFVLPIIPIGSFLEEYCIDLQTTQDEENFILKNFFEFSSKICEVQPTLKWTQVILKHGDFELAKCCIMALSYIHLELNAKGAYYIDKIVEYLFQYINQYPDLLHSDYDVSCHKVPSKVLYFNSMKNLLNTDEKKNLEQINKYSILLLVYVFLLGSCLDSGRASISRVFLRVGSIISQNLKHEVVNKNNENYEIIQASKKLVYQLKYTDALMAITSADCRLPLFEVNWMEFNDPGDNTIFEIMGCPAEIIECISKIAVLKHELTHIKNGNNGDNGNNGNNGNNRYNKVEKMEFYNDIKQRLVNYRDYMPLKRYSSESLLSLKVVKCWTIAIHISLLNATKIENYKIIICNLVVEFFDILKQLQHPNVTTIQMVWVISTIGCECNKNSEYQKVIIDFLDQIYFVFKVGNVKTLKRILQNIWDSQTSWESVLQGKEWLESGVEFIII